MVTRLWDVAGGAIVGEDTGAVLFVSADSIDALPVSTFSRVEIDHDALTFPDLWAGRGVGYIELHEVWVFTGAVWYQVKCGVNKQARLWATRGEPVRLPTPEMDYCHD